MIETVLLNSMQRLLPNTCPQGIDRLSGLRNEPLSFQVAYRLNEKNAKQRIYITVESDLPVSCYSVGYVPVLNIDTDGIKDPSPAGLLPDILYPHEAKPALTDVRGWATEFFEKGQPRQLYALGNAWNAIWITVNEEQKKMPAGIYPVTVRFFDCKTREEAACTQLSVRLYPAALPKQKFLYTNWLHCDCIADVHRAEMFSDRFFAILDSYLYEAGKHGMNMVLLPAFTPPLDTPVGKCRRPAQLVGVTKDGDHYTFDFTLMKRFCDLCRKNGIGYFEHAHFFTQWGAVHAPAVYATVNGKQKRIFGWETSSKSRRYGDFLRQYLRALKKFLAEEGLTKKILFHVSDEPNESMRESYRDALNQVRDELKGFMRGDALSDYSFYEEGLVETPIVATDHLDGYYGKCKNYWAYYTGDQCKNGMSNRIFAVSGACNRSLGFQLYKYRVKGFLQWGYNYYYDTMSHGLFDPKTQSEEFDSVNGTSYCVYPENDRALPSIRQKVFFEGINDLRALYLLEKQRGKAACEQLLSKHFGEVTVYTSAKTPEQLIAFREELNQMLS